MKNIHLVIIAFGLLLRIISLNQSFWLDEASQAVISRQNFFSINFNSDFQPPLFYALTHLWQSFGIKNEAFLRFLPLFIGIFAIYTTYILAKKLFGEKKALLASFIVAISSNHIYFSQEYRMYSLLTLFALLSWLYLYNRKYILYTIFTTLNLYTHYFSIIILVSQLFYIFLFRKKETGRFLKSLFFSTILFSIWLPTLCKQFQFSSYLLSVWPKWGSVSGINTIKFLPLLSAKLVVGMISFENVFLYSLIVLIPISLFIYASIVCIALLFSKNKKSDEISLLLCSFYIPVFLGIVMSFFTYANAPHRFSFLLPFFSILYSVGTLNSLEIKDKKIFKLFKKIKLSFSNLNTFKITLYISILCVCSILFFCSLIYLFNPKFHRENWRKAVLYTDNMMDKNDITLSLYTSPWAPIEWYSKKPSQNIGASADMNISEESIYKQLENALQNAKHVFLYTYLWEVSDPNLLVEQYLKNKGYIISNEKDLRGVGIIKRYVKLKTLE